MSNRNTFIVALVIIVVATIASAVIYPQLPEISASHWDAEGNVNGYMSSFWAAFLMPLVSVGLLLMFMAIPSIDPLKANITQFRNYYNIFVTVIIVFMLVIHGITLAWNLGYDQFNIGMAIMPLVGLIFIVVGAVIRKAKRNFFVGIRTPWTLTSDYVWDETHKLGGILFMVAGVITVFTFPLGELGMWIVMPAALIAGFVPIIYSYILFVRQGKGG